MLTATPPKSARHAFLKREAGEAIDIRGLTKRYGDFHALRNVDLRVEPGEFIAILGSSGSGKSTLLMALAGFVEPDSGSILVRGRNIVPTPANARGFGVVFQNYALFPHMSVAENVMFPLQLRRVRREEARERAIEALETVKLGPFADRRIDALSGGQRQRVALARAIVYQPPVLLMDEPLSALDKSLREEMQIEIRELHDKLNITTLYVTHDQREALTMADRIAVMSKGEILQIDTPERIYRRPASEFVARFLGEAIVLSGEEAGRVFAGRLPPAPPGATGVMVRCEDVMLAPPAGGPGLALNGTVHGVVFQGDSWLVQIDLGNGHQIAARAQRAAAGIVAGLKAGDAATFHVNPDDLHFIRPDA
ncbi:ABC transporter ATP-binding protein [Pseudoxanthobacter sp.]|uniref:ABC transporter ATP-binding protein n=1 Tax=Pseudoxanthobacter sp. TaxID=1925742 RepID=UPI002FE2042A